MKLTLKNSADIDWLRLVIPYEYTDIKAMGYKSATNQPIDSASTIEDIDSMVIKLKKAMQLYYGVEFTDIVKDYEDKFRQWVTCDPLWGYDRGIAYGKIKIFYNEVDHTGKAPVNRLDMGMAIELSGSACQQLKDSAKRYKMTLLDILKQIKETFPQVKCTRLDLCYDKYDKNRYLTPSAIWKAFERNQITCKANKFRNYRSGEYNDDKKIMTGETTYIGSTPRMLRIYDKSKERFYGHGDKWVDANAYWVRFEFQLQDVYATAMFNTLLADTPMEDAFFDYLADFMTIVKHKEKNKYGHEITRKDRKSPTSYWNKFIDSPNRKKVYIARKEGYDIGRSQRWIEGSVSKTLTKQVLNHIIKGGDPVRYINHIIEQGKSRFTTSDFQELQLMMEQSNGTDEVIQELNSRQVQYGVYESDDGVEFNFKEMLDVMSGNAIQDVNDLPMYDIYGNEVD